MTCKTNERSALNTFKTRALVVKHNVVPLKADKTHKNPDIKKLLEELGNPTGNIPFYAIYPGDGGAPIVFGGQKGLITQSEVLENLKEAGPSVRKSDATATALKQ